MAAVPASAGVGASTALRRKEAVCGPPSSGQAAKAWNEWLDERDRAPGEVLGDWFKGKLQEGVEVAYGYARAGLDLAKSRAETAKAGRALLDQGETARDAIRLKQQANRAVASDQSIIEALRYYSRTYKEEAAFQLDPSVKASFTDKASVFMQALEALGEAPGELAMTPIERDASALMRLGQAAAGIGRPLSLAGGEPTLALAGSTRAAPSAGQRSSSLPATNSPGGVQHGEAFENLLEELFRLHDLNGNGSIEESELIKLNQKIAMLHYGKGADKAAVRDKFSAMFRANFDPDGNPVLYPAFRRYTLKVLQGLDSSRAAQEMILEQFIAEAQSARAAFHCPSFASVTDAEYIRHLAGDKPIMGSLISIAESPCASTASGAPSPETPPQGRGLSSLVSSGADLSGALTSSASSGARPKSSTMADRIAADAARAAPDVLRSRSEQPRMPGSDASAPPPPAARDGGAVGRLPSSPRDAVGRHDSQASSGTVDTGRHPSTTTQDLGMQASDWPSLADQREEERRVTGGFATKDRVQVWSNSKREWLDGVVLQAFVVKCEAEGYSVPAGTIKVQSAAGVKWIRPGQAAGALRALDAQEH